MMILVVIMMLGQCMLPERAFDNSESNDYTWSDEVYSFWLWWVSQQNVETCKQALDDTRKMCIELLIITVYGKAIPTPNSIHLW